MRKREKSMKFRPCIDIHNGKVKQIVGGSLMDTGNQADENFVSDYDGGFYANLYKENGLTGGHIILLNPVGSDYYEADVEQAKAALMAYPGGLQIGGGMNADNARRFLDMGASHIIVTSYVFRDGQINYENLEAIKAAVGKEHLVLDLSCRKRDGKYYVVTDRWQKYTDVELSVETLDHLSSYCDEFLIHAVDVEGKASGIEQELVTMIGEWNKIPVTYAGGVRNEHDLQLLKELGHGQLDVTIGSALDLFGGSMKFESVLKYCD
jgi:phosphoribosylformimino-5-aminoimidazole carboxamide ribotide isomerase